MPDLETESQPVEWLAAVVPCYNAGARVLPVVEQLVQVAGRVVVVDDGSTDGCIDALRGLPIDLLHFPANRGKGHALLAGFARAMEDSGVRAICVLDADGQHNPQELPRFVRAFEEQAPDLIIGARQFGGGHVPLRSRFGNVLTVGVTRLLLGTRLPDTQCGFRLLSRPFAEAVVREVAGGRYETEMEIIVKAIRSGRKVIPVSIATIYEAGNASSHFHKLRDSFLIYARLLRTVFMR